jgi:AhpD family alkylhydroperoxidase
VIIVTLSGLLAIRVPVRTVGRNEFPRELAWLPCRLRTPLTAVGLRRTIHGEPDVGGNKGGAAMYDMKHLTRLKKLGELAPEAWKGFLAFDEAAFKEGVIPLKYKELMAVAVALTTQCPYCIEIHAKRAKKAGATEQELAETTLIAAALRAGGAVTHGTHTLE